jgi:hypothetical protein
MPMTARSRIGWAFSSRERRSLALTIRVWRDTLAPLEAHKGNGIEILTDEQRQRQVQRIVQSAAFRNASMLQQLLQFLAARVGDHSGDTLKEYTIGVEAFSRSQDFDPKTDTIVRVQIHRLRQKLKEYYEADGNRDPILIEIPKGHYLPTFQPVWNPDLDHNGALEAIPNGAGSHGHESAVETAAAPERSTGRFAFARFIVVATLAGVAAAALLALGFWMGEQSHTHALPVSTDSSSALSSASPSGIDRSVDPVRAFWSALVGKDPNPVIAYPDAVFLLDNFNDLFRFRRGATDFRGAPVDPHVAQEFASNPKLVARAGPLYYENSYLGFGELKAVGLLSNLFGQMGLKPVIKPSRDVTADDLKLHNVIMLGSSAQNIAVAQLSDVGDFRFKLPDTRIEEWRGIIVNDHPRPGESPVYRVERDAHTQVLQSDYSLITIQPGLVPGRYIANLGGLDTTGTEGAVVFATSRSGVEELFRILRASGHPGSPASLPFFQALLNVRLQKGYEVLGASLVAVHPLAEKGVSAENPAAPPPNQ